MDQRLSIVAQYDDLIRYCETLIGGDLIEEKVYSLLQSCEKQRIFCLIQRNELNEAQEQIKKLKKENNSLEITLKNVRATFASVVNSKEKLKHERDSLIEKITVIKNFLLEDVKDNSKVKERILNSLNANKLPSAPEHSMSADISLSDIEFDKTEDDLLGNQLHSTRNRFSDLDFENKQKNKKIDRERRLSKEFEEDIRLEREMSQVFRKRKSSLGNNYNPSPKKVQQNDENKLGEEKLNDEPGPLGKFRSGSSIISQMNALSQSLIKQRLSIPSLNGLNDLKIDSRPHHFVIKKVLRPEKCGPCGQSIGFCSSKYHCRDCRAICHMSCKDKVPLPCIPYVSRANIGKQGKLVLISDFTPQNMKPCVPALIIHCCTEIEKRGLETIGLYKISGSKKDVNELKELILDSKKGMPNLNTIDVYVLCGIVKEFLRSLDESLITKLAWRDFVTGAAITDDEQRELYLYDLISNLHVANRDTLAYMILHLQKIAESPDCKMPASTLAKVFGPTIVGFSMKDPPAEQNREEILKQIAVMEALLELSAEFWESLLSQKFTIPLTHKESLNQMICSLNRGSSLSSKVDGYRTYSNSRMSIGSRLCGGRVASGTLTPLKPTNIRPNSSKISSLKPLF